MPGRVMKIILDTNFLLIPGSLRVDLFSEIDRICSFPYQICVLDKQIDELEKIALEQGGKVKLSANLAKKLISEKGLKLVETEKNKNVDDLIVEIANKDEFIVGTQDKALKDKLKLKGVKLIVLRQKNHLELQ